jgi:hypothetical protein
MNRTVLWGLITGVMLVTFGLVVTLSDNNTESTATSMVYAVLAAGILLGVRSVRTAKGGVITFGKAFGTGMGITAICAILSGIFTYIKLTSLAPELLEQMKANAEAGLDTSEMTAEEIQAAESALEAFTSPAILSVIDVFSTLFIGALFALVVAAVFKRNQAPAV